MPKFIRQEYLRHSKIGKNRKKLQKWRRPKGRDSKMRLKRKSYPISPSIGYRTPRKERGSISGKTPFLIHNLSELKLLNKNQIAILAKIGAKKKLDLMKYAQENKIKILNVKENSK